MRRVTSNSTHHTPSSRHVQVAVRSASHIRLATTPPAPEVEHCSLAGQRRYQRRPDFCNTRTAHNRCTIASRQHACGCLAAAPMLNHLPNGRPLSLYICRMDQPSANMNPVRNPLSFNRPVQLPVQRLAHRSARPSRHVQHAQSLYQQHPQTRLATVTPTPTP